MIRKKCQIMNQLGLHARAAAKFIHIASRFESQIEIIYNNQTANGKSIMGVMMLGAATQNWVEILADGKDEDEAMVAISELIANRFGEEN